MQRRNTLTSRALITACLNGARARQEHVALPVDPPSIGAAAQGAVAAGAALIHVHPRDRDGRESLDAVDVARTVQALRRMVPGIPVGVTTGVWVTGDHESQVAAVAQWDRAWLPDLASVNFDEPAPERVGAALFDLGVGVEAGLSTPASADRFMGWPERARVARILIEPMEQDSKAAIVTAQRILERLSGESRPTQVHGHEKAAWPVLEWAATHGYEVRAGFEDMLHLPSGPPAADNAAIVAAAVVLRLL